MLTLNRKAIGIFGGSFDPPHKGHVEISKISLKKIKLKKIYWIITKKNPFKRKPFFSLGALHSICSHLNPWANCLFIVSKNC